MDFLKSVLGLGNNIKNFVGNEYNQAKNFVSSGVNQAQNFTQNFFKAPPVTFNPQNNMVKFSTPVSNQIRNAAKPVQQLFSNVNTQAHKATDFLFKNPVTTIPANIANTMFYKPAKQMLGGAADILNTQKTPVLLSKEGMGATGKMLGGEAQLVTNAYFGSRQLLKKPLDLIIGGGLNAALQAGQNYLSGKPLTDDLAKAGAEGVQFAALGGAINELNTQLIGKLTPYLTNKSVDQVFKLADTLTGDAKKRALLLGMKRVAQQALADIPANLVGFAGWDTLKGDKNFVSALEDNLAGTLLQFGTHVAGGGGRAALVQSKGFREGLAKAIAQTLKDTGADISAVLNDKKFAQGFIDPAAKLGGDVQTEMQKPFQGFNDLTTKILEELKGKTTVSKQFVSDLTKRGDIKQGERDVIQETLAEFPDGKINAEEFANAVKKKLMPLKTNESSRWESINLSDHERPDIAKYSENVYQAPFKTEAGNVHYSGDGDNYFGHVRYEDVADAKKLSNKMGEFEVKTSTENGRAIYNVVEKETGNPIASMTDPARAQAEVERLQREGLSQGSEGGTRRILEIQSDLFQKGKYEQEIKTPEQINSAITYFKSEIELAKNKLAENPNLSGFELKKEQQWLLDSQKKLEQLQDGGTQKQKETFLNQYKNNWHERLIREELKKAAQDGKEFVQFPTGKTVAKIEGYINEGEGGVPPNSQVGDIFDYGGEDYQVLKQYADDGFDVIPKNAVKGEYTFDDFKDGEIDYVQSDLQDDPTNFGYEVTDWLHKNFQDIPKDVQKALTKADWKNDEEAMGQVMKNAFDEGKIDAYDVATGIVEDVREIKDKEAAVQYLNDMGDGMKYYSDHWDEDAPIYTIDPSDGDVEVMNPGTSEENFNPNDLPDAQKRVVNFYEKEVAKYLRRIEPKMEETFDDAGNSWYQVPVNAALAKAPVEALGLAAGAEPEKDKNGNYTGKVNYNATKGLMGVGVMAGVSRLKGKGGKAVGRSIGEAIMEAEKMKMPKEEIKLPGQKMRGFPETVKDTPGTPEKVAEDVTKSPESYYTPVTNEETTARIKKEVLKKGEDYALSVAKSDKHEDANATAMLLIDKFLKSNQFEKATDLINKVSPRFTKQGQQIQILSLYGRLTPTGAIRFAQKIVDQANDKLPKGRQIKLTPEVTERISDFAKRIEGLPEGSRERIVATAQLMQEIQNQVPVSLGKKIAAIQTMAQLLNPKTAIRNIVGNLGFGALENVKDVVAAPIDAVTSLFTGQRTKTLPNVGAQLKGFGRGLAEGIEDVNKGIDTSGGAATQFELQNNGTFKKGPLKWAEKLLSYTLKVPDRAFYQSAYDGSLASQMKAAGVTEPTEQMMVTAASDAAYKTFQDNSKIAEVFSGVKKILNKPTGGEFGLGDLILKYPKTPGNILARGVDYSPLGFVKTIYSLVHPFVTGNEFNQKEFVENLSRSLVGTGIITTGFVLGKLGIISGQPPKDFDISSVERAMGKGGFKINMNALTRYFNSGFDPDSAKTETGDTVMSYDWFQPQSIMLSMGADMSKGGNAASQLATIIDGLESGVQSLTQQPLVKGVTDFTSDIKSKGPVTALTNAALNSASGFTPSFFNQVGQLTDNTTRETYDPNPFKQAMNKVQARLPIAREGLPARVDVFGQEQETYQDDSNNIFNVFFNPAFISKVKDNPEGKEVLDLFQRTGETKQAPRAADKKVKINGEDMELTTDQYLGYQKYIGTKTQTAFKTAMETQTYQSADDEGKVEILADLLTDVNSAAKITLFGNEPQKVTKGTRAILAGGVHIIPPKGKDGSGTGSGKGGAKKGKKGKKFDLTPPKLSQIQSKNNAIRATAQTAPKDKKSSFNFKFKSQSAVAQNAPKVQTPIDIQRLIRATQAQISPEARNTVASLRGASGPGGKNLKLSKSFYRRA